MEKKLGWIVAAALFVVGFLCFFFLRLGRTSERIYSEDGKHFITVIVYSRDISGKTRGIYVTPGPMDGYLPTRNYFRIPLNEVTSFFVKWRGDTVVFRAPYGLIENRLDSGKVDFHKDWTADEVSRFGKDPDSSWKNINR